MQLRRIGGFALMFALAAVPRAHAALTCTVQVAVTPTLRDAGLVELTGDLILVCNGTAPSSGISGSLTVTLNTTVTSKLLGGASEALVLINEPLPGTQVLGTNVFEGVVSGDSVTFTGIPFAAAPGGTVTNRVLRITNVRADASALVLSSGTAPVTATVSTDSTAVSLVDPTQTVGFVQEAIAVSLLCNTAGTVNVQFAELFATALKVQGGTGQSTPGTFYNTESGFTPDPIIPGVGTADSGTELTVIVSGLDPGAQLSVPATITSGGLTITAIAPAGGGLVPVIAGTATIVYEVTAADPNQNDVVTIPITVGSTHLTGVTVRGNLAPISTVAMASANAPIPRFIDDSTEMPFGRSCEHAPVLNRSWLMGLTLALLTLGMLVVRRRSVR
jgi:hypothetical protein